MKPDRSAVEGDAKRTHHPQVLIRHGEWQSEVDAHIAPLVLELWKTDIATTASCQRHSISGKVWISFATATDAEDFMNIVLAPAAQTIPTWERAEQWYFGQYEAVAAPLRYHPPPLTSWPTNPGDWEFHVSVADGAYYHPETGEAHDHPIAAPCITLGIAVLFPRRDYKTVLARMCAHNKRGRTE